jgi:6-pyruvoyltetrahydropterin/6-carboxytetrahydropterin synthase
MIYTLEYSSRFRASHVLDGHPFCGKMHGHTFKVFVKVVGDPEPEVFNMVANDNDLMTVVDTTLEELDNRHLNDMLPALIPSAQGVAAWLWERLQMKFQLYEVTIWQDDLRASVHRE